MSIFKVDTPSNIDTITEAEILELCDSFGRVKKPEGRVKMIKIIYKLLGYDLSQDLLYALADESKEQFIIAPAGGGKTTMVSVKISLVKMYRQSQFTLNNKVKGDRMLSLVYGTNNVKDMVDRHYEIVSKINSLGIKGLEIDFDLECRTMHSFCLKWMEVYKVEMGLVNYKLYKSSESTPILTNCILNVCKKAGLPRPPTGLTPSNVLQLYNYVNETMTTLESIKDSEKVVDLGVDYQVLEKIFKAYSNTKRITRRYDYTDLLVNFRKLMFENEVARKRVQEYYDYITADEIQDFTPIMMDILKLIIGDHTSLICIGDDDQAIYQFRGADNKNALRFKDIFPESKILLLKTNRRCPSNVLNLADNIIKLNEDRFSKEMRGIKGPGEIHFKAYNDRIGQYLSIAKLVDSFTEEYRSDTVIGYREKYSSLILSNLLYSSNKPFHVISGYGPFDYELFNHLNSVLSALNSKNDKRKLLNLYKVLPISRAEMQESLHFDPKTSSFTDGQNFIDIEKIQFLPVRMNNELFKKIYSSLIWISQNMDVLSCKKYVPMVLGLVQKYFWTFMSKDSSVPDETAEYCTNFVLEFFNKNSNYKEVSAFYLSEKSRLDGYNKSKIGVGLSTFHSLKGLEYKNVILCDLAESIFPNYSGIEFRPYDDKTKNSLKECENRLFYVAVTRSKQNLWFYYSKSDPSYYISFLKDEAYNQSEIACLLDEDSEPTVVLDSSNLFEDSSKFVTLEDETNEVVIEVEEVILHKEEDLSVKAKEVKLNYSKDYRNNLMTSLFKR